MTHVEHIAIWTHDLKRFKVFHEIYVGAQASSEYINEKKQFESYGAQATGIMKAASSAPTVTGLRLSSRHGFEPFC